MNASNELAPVQEAQRPRGKSRPAGVPQRPSLSVQTCMSLVNDAHLDLNRHVAAHQALAGALATHTGTLSEGERQHGLPLFSFSASADGVHATECVIDLKDVAAEQVPYVLVPLINAQIAALSATLARYRDLLAGLEGILEEARTALHAPAAS